MINILPFHRNSPFGSLSIPENERKSVDVVGVAGAANALFFTKFRHYLKKRNEDEEKDGEIAKE